MTCDQEDSRRLHGGELALELGSDVERRVERAVHRWSEEIRARKHVGPVGWSTEGDLECGL